MNHDNIHSLWRVIIRAIMLMVVSLSTASCSAVFEDDDNCECEPRRYFKINLHFDFDFANSQLTLVRGDDAADADSAADAQSADNMLLRCTVYAYRNDVSTRGASRIYDSPDEQFSLFYPVSDLSDRQLDISLPSGDWSLYVWADYYRDDEQFAYYYITDFSEISLNEDKDHRGTDDYRDAFRGYGEVSIDALSQEPTADVTIDMERPLAKFEFVTTDLDEFTAKVIASQKDAEANMSTAQSPDLSSEVSEAPAESPQKIPVNLDRYTIRFYYQGFMPSAFNMFYDKPSNALTGVWFDGKITRLNDSEALIGFDYVFVNHEATSVTLVVAVYDVDGTLLSVTSGYEVPIERNIITIVKGEFLTSSANGGTQISPSFNGSYNIYFP